MKKCFLKVMLPALIFTAVISGSCKKISNTSGSTFPSEINIHLVSDSVAKNIAKAFNPTVFFNTAVPTNHYPFKSTLNGNNNIKNVIVINDSFNVPAFYICNFENNQGFLFVSGDYQLRPMLGYCHQGEFKKGITAPSGLANWMIKTIYNIETVREGLYNDSIAANAAWQNYPNQNNSESHLINDSTQLVARPATLYPPNNPIPCQGSTTTSTVGPLLSVTWGQACTYNEVCPKGGCSVYDYNFNSSTPDIHYLTGCVATAMAQVTKYWSPPGSSVYNYPAMTTTTGNSQVQLLMAAEAASVDMSWGCGTTKDGGSSAVSSSIPVGLKSYFGFSSANYESYDGNNIITNLNSHWPVLLGGCNGQTNKFLGLIYSCDDGHEWVCDGYNSTNYTTCSNNTPISTEGMYLHMNWGWHEWYTNAPYPYTDFNGWFAIDNWTIANTGNCQGTTCDYQYQQDMVTEIHP